MIRESPITYQQLLVKGLVHDACAIHNVLKYNVILKVDDCINITPLLSVVTYFIMTNTTFNIIDLLIWHIENLTIARNPQFNKKHNLALGHMIVYLLEVKYNISYPIELKHIPSHFTNHSFHDFF